MLLRRSPAPCRRRSRSALNSSPPRYLSPRRTRGSERRSAMISAELLFKSLSLLSAMPYLLLHRSADREAMRTTRRALVLGRVRRRCFRGPLHILDEDAPAGARTSHTGELHA